MLGGLPCYLEVKRKILYPINTAGFQGPEIAQPSHQVLRFTVELRVPNWNPITGNNDEIHELDSFIHLITTPELERYKYRNPAYNLYILQLLDLNRWNPEYFRILISKIIRIIPGVSLAPFKGIDPQSFYG